LHLRAAGGGAEVQALPRIAAAASQARPRARRGRPMWLLLLEALAALALLIFIVWWVMFAGRKKGERRGDDEPR
jgi:cyanate permease